MERISMANKPKVQRTLNKDGRPRKSRKPKAGVGAPYGNQNARVHGLCAAFRSAKGATPWTKALNQRRLKNMADHVKDQGHDSLYDLTMTERNLLEIFTGELEAVKVAIAYVFSQPTVEDFLRASERIFGGPFYPILRKGISEGGKTLGYARIPKEIDGEEIDRLRSQYEKTKGEAIPASKPKPQTVVALPVSVESSSPVEGNVDELSREQGATSTEKPPLPDCPLGQAGQ